MDGIIELETCSIILQHNHIREKDLTSILSFMSHSTDKISNTDLVMIQLKFNSSLQTRIFSASHTLTKLLLMNAEREELMFVQDMNLLRSISTISERKLPLSKMLTLVLLWNMLSPMLILLLQVDHGKHFKMPELLMQTVSLMLTNTLFNTKDLKISLHGEMLSEETSQEPMLPLQLKTQSSKTIF